MGNKLLAAVAAFLLTSSAFAGSTLPIRGNVAKADNPGIQYIGRVDFTNPERPAFNFPGTEIRANFEGTSLKMIARPMSGYFMVQIDSCEAFKVSFNNPTDSVVTLATALDDGEHTVRVAYAMEGLETHPEFWGFVLDEDCDILKPTPLPERRIEFIGNSITCAYGVESTEKTAPFEYATENHFYSYATMVSDALGAIHTSISRSGIGVYRNYNGPKTGDKVCMPQEFKHTLFADTTLSWDFSRWQPEVVCINLGTNDFSTDNYDPALYEKAYRNFLTDVRKVYPKAKIVLLSGPMLGEKENGIEKGILDKLQKERAKKGDKAVYRFDFTPQTGALGYGASWHPSFKQQQLMAQELTPFIRDIMKW